MRQPHLKRSPFKVLRPYIVITAELGGVFAVLGTIVSLVMNSARFERWDINFLSVATPADVFMSGLDVSIIASIGLISIGIYVAAITLIVIAVRFISFAKPRLKRVIVMALVLFTIAAHARALFGIIDTALVWAWAAAIVITYLYFNRDDEIRMRYTGVPAALIAIVAILAVATDSIRKNDIRFGYFPDFGDYYSPRYYGTVDNSVAIPNCNTLNIYWTGTESVIASCDTRYDQYLILPRDKVVIALEPQAFGPLPTEPGATESPSS